MLRYRARPVGADCRVGARGVAHGDARHFSASIVRHGAKKTSTQRHKFRDPFVLDPPTAATPLVLLLSMISV